MKKVYEKPLMTYESFELSTSIAEGCALISNAVQFSCAVVYEFGKLFIDDNNCDIYTPGLADGLCYHVPQPENSIFSS